MRVLDIVTLVSVWEQQRRRFLPLFLVDGMNAWRCTAGRLAQSDLRGLARPAGPDATAAALQRWQDVLERRTGRYKLPTPPLHNTSLIPRPLTCQGTKPPTSASRYTTFTTGRHTVSCCNRLQPGVVFTHVQHCYSFHSITGKRSSNISL